MKMLHATMMMVLGLSVGCAGMAEDQTGRTPAGETVPSSSVDAAASYALPAGARIIADAVNDRFVVATSDGQSAYALGRVVSCGCEGTCAPVAFRGSIHCTAGADLRVSEYHYFPLERPAAALTDEHILAAPELSVFALEPNTTRSCGIKPDDFGPVIKRFAEDMLATSSDQKRHTRLLLEYNGAPAVWAAPQGLFPEYDRAGSYVVEIDSDSITCKCKDAAEFDDSTGCTAAGGGVEPEYCDSGTCSKCSLKPN